MIPNDLKILRKEMGLRQKDLGEILCVPYRTLQNWEQPEGSREHRKIPEEFADKIKVLADLQRDMKGGGHFQKILFGCKYHFAQMN